MMTFVLVVVYLILAGLWLYEPDVTETDFGEDKLVKRSDNEEQR